MKENSKPIISKEKLMEAGVYYGHRKSQWNPKMKPYITKTIRGVHIIDLQKTVKTLEFVYGIIQKMAERDAEFIFVGTRTQAKNTIKENATRANALYASERWLGGTLTNNRTIFRRVRRMFELEKMAETNFEGYTKKEGVLFEKELAKLQKNLNGIRNMKRRPSVMIVADPSHDINAVKEARKLGMKVIGILDTNTDPSLVDIGIPANDDSVRSLTLILTVLTDAIVTAKNGTAKYAFRDDSEVILPEEPKRERKVQRRPRRDFNNGGNYQTRTSNRVSTENKDSKPKVEKAGE